MRSQEGLSTVGQAFAANLRLAHCLRVLDVGDSAVMLIPSCCAWSLPGNKGGRTRFARVSIAAVVPQVSNDSAVSRCGTLRPASRTPRQSKLPFAVVCPMIRVAIALTICERLPLRTNRSCRSPVEHRPFDGVLLQSASV